MRDSHAFPEAHARAGWLRWLWLAVAIVVLDQLTKLAVQGALAPGESRAWSPFFSLVLTFNSGAAFSFLSGESGWQRWLFTLIALVAVAVIAVLLRRGGSRWYCAGLALILGGAVGNLIDRLAIGHVVDFLLFYWNAHAFPAFNVADSAITLGAAALIVDSLRMRREAHA